MKLSSLDIRKQEFTRVVRGYDKEEVDAFLQLVANQWQELVDDLRREEEKINDLNDKLEHYQKVEEALEEALKTAKHSSKQTLENAEQKAKLIVEEAEAKAVDITRSAESERLDVKKDAAKYSVRQKEILAKLRAFLMSELEILAQYESEAPVNYIKLMPAEASDLMEEGAEAELVYDSETELDEIHQETELVEKETEQEDRAKSKSKSKPREASRAPVESKEPEVSDEIEKIRRILEDLEK